MSGPPQGPFATPAMRPWINRWVAFVIFYAWVAVFRLSDVVYLANMQNMVGDTQLLAEDIQMMFYASFIGMTIIFPVLFRLKFRFTTKGILTGVTLSLAVLNLLFMLLLSGIPVSGSTTLTLPAPILSVKVPLLVVLALLSGALRIWGMFECMSSIMSGITSKRDFAVFFPVIYFTVVGFIQLTGYVATHLTYKYSWQAMNVLDIGLLLAVCLCVRLLLRNFRMGPPMPLYGIDWLGAVLWAIVLGAITVIAVYGDYLEWSGHYLATAASIAFLATGINLGRMKYIRHPYIEYKLFSYPNVSSMLVLFALLCFLLTAQTSLQHVLTGQILHWQPTTTVSLNLWQWLGIAVGAVFSRYALTHLGWSYKQLTFAGFLFVVYYLAAMYFLVSAEVNIEKLRLQVFLLGMGNVTVYISVTVYMQKVIPFSHFFQGLCLLGFVRTGIANPISAAIYTRLLRIATIEYGSLMALRELYGMATVVGFITLLLILASRFKPELNYLIPTDWMVYRRLQKWNTKLKAKITK